MVALRIMGFMGFMVTWPISSVTIEPYKRSMRQPQNWWHLQTTDDLTQKKK